MDLLHSRPYSGTREESDVMKLHQASSFELEIPSETICINVTDTKMQYLSTQVRQNLGFH